MSKLTSTRRRRGVPCQEEATTDELLVVARVRLTGHPENRQEGGDASFQIEAIIVCRTVITPSSSDKHVALVPAPHLHQCHVPACHRSRCRSGAVVQDEDQVAGADLKRAAQFGGGVHLRDFAGLGGSQGFQFASINDTQTAVLVGDVDDCEAGGAGSRAQ